MIKDESGFILKAYVESVKCLKLFKQDIDEVSPNENFGMDVRVELKPNIICEQNDSKDNNSIKKNLVK